ncbi:MAG: hypothetical protein ACT4OK_20190 [Gemmobacter sp.]
MTTGTNRFVIYEPTMLVALDLEGALRDHDPRAEVIVATSLAEALGLLAQGQVGLAVLHAGAEVVPATGLPVLLIGDAAEERPGSRPVLLRPFSADDVARALTLLGVTPGLASA